MTIKKYLAKHRLSICEFSQLVGVAYGTVWRWMCENEDGNRKPSIKYAKQISQRTRGEIKMEDLY